jgi:26S proteasome regulatory subunit N5
MCKELINFDALCNVYGKELLALDVFNQETTHGKKSWIELKNRLVEHVSIECIETTKMVILFAFSFFQNVRIIGSYYTRINLKRMAELLDLSTAETEEYLAKLVNNGTLKVKTDRPSGIIYFQTRKTSSEVLNDWGNGLNELMSLVNKTCHLINKEECINNVMIAASSQN